MRTVCEFCRRVPSEHYGLHRADRTGESLWNGRVCLQPQNVSVTVDELN